MENSTHRRTLCFSSYDNRKLKLKLWWVGARERKKRAFFILLILSEAIFFNIFVLSQCIVYWIHFQNIHTCSYQKPLLYTLFCLFLKLPQAFSVSSSTVSFLKYFGLMMPAIVWIKLKISKEYSQSKLFLNTYKWILTSKFFLTFEKYFRSKPILEMK